MAGSFPLTDLDGRLTKLEDRVAKRDYAAAKLDENGGTVGGNEGARAVNRIGVGVPFAGFGEKGGAITWEG